MCCAIPLYRTHVFVRVAKHIEHPSVTSTQIGIVRRNGAKRQLEKRVERLPSDIQCRKAGRRKHDKLLMRRSTDMPKQCGLTRSGLAGQEEALVCAFDQAEHIAHLLIGKVDCGQALLSLFCLATRHALRGVCIGL